MQKLLFRRPDSETIRRFLEVQENRDYSYDHIGSTAGRFPTGFVVDHSRSLLGVGEAVYRDAKKAMQNWCHFNLSWLSVFPPEAPVQQGQVVITVVKSLGVWWLNACRIVYVMDSCDRPNRFGFAYGTLPGHAGIGEERFLLEKDQDEKVWFSIDAFSRPGNLLSRLGYFHMRRLQKKFGRDSCQAMISSVSDCSSPEH